LFILQYYYYSVYIYNIYIHILYIYIYISGFPGHLGGRNGSGNQTTMNSRPLGKNAIGGQLIQRAQAAAGRRP
jgi:hypothetical protein